MAPRTLGLSVGWPDGVRMQKVAPDQCQFSKPSKYADEHRDFTLEGPVSRSGASALLAFGATGHAKK